MAIRPTVTAVEASIMPEIKKFLEQRSAQLAKKSNSTPEEGTDMLAEAIAIGVTKALAHPTLESAFSVIVDTNAAAVIPIGKTAYIPLGIAAKIPTVPNPNLSRPY